MGPLASAGIFVVKRQAVVSLCRSPPRPSLSPEEAEGSGEEGGGRGRGGRGGLSGGLAASPPLRNMQVSGGIGGRGLGVLQIVGCGFWIFFFFFSVC